jgi:uncharacterized alpha-E superfamily protein
MWERINYYHLWLKADAREVYDTNRHEFYAQVKRINHLVHGIADATMSHGEAWEFFQLGTYLERASQTARIMDVKYHTLLPKVEDVGTPVDNAHWLAILMSCSGYEPFHKKPKSVPMEPGAAVAEFLLYDNEFPRSIRRCVWECEAAAEAAAGNPVGREPTAAEREIRELLEWFDSRTSADIMRDGLHEALTHIVDSVIKIGNAVQASFFAAEVKPPPPPRPRAAMSQSQS